MNSKSNLGFVGLGIMGAPMAGHLRAAGHTLFVTTRSQVPAALLQAGAVNCANAADVARQADIIVTRVPDTPDTPDLEQVLFGKGGIADDHGGGPQKHLHSVLPLRQWMGKKMTHVGGSGGPPHSRSVWRAHGQTHLQPGLSHQTAPEGFEPGAQAERRRQIG